MPTLPSRYRTQEVGREITVRRLDVETEEHAQKLNERLNLFMRQVAVQVRQADITEDRLTVRLGESRIVIKDFELVQRLKRLEALEGERASAETAGVGIPAKRRGRKAQPRQVTKASTNLLGAINISVSQIFRYARERGEYILGERVPDAVVECAAARNALYDTTGTIPLQIYAKLIEGKCLSKSDLDLLIGGTHVD